MAYTKAVATLNQTRHTATHASCGVNSRRVFDKAQDSTPEEANYALSLIRQRYRVEKHIRGQALNNQEKTDYRYLLEMDTTTTILTQGFPMIVNKC